MPELFARITSANMTVLLVPSVSAPIVVPLGVRPAASGVKLKIPTRLSLTSVLWETAPILPK